MFNMTILFRIPTKTVELQPGDCMDRETFHALYDAMPEGFKAELIGGVVMVPFAASSAHSDAHGIIMAWLNVYRAATPGVRALDNTTVLLGPDSEPQPDAVLLVRPEHGGRTRVSDGYIAGPPELIVEVAYTSRNYDLNAKYRDYEAAGVLEYVVPLIERGRVEWFVLRDGAFRPLPPGEDGLYRSEAFPGLWLDPAALLDGDVARVLNVLRRGLDAPEHAEFVARLGG
ncbi:MAG TPA: Uma2 family endonuclease, partial [Isosphaeraceae bacterium]|nr:Uma2 family endonuclease [Isosphaeraceae bacterium]